MFSKPESSEISDTYTAVHMVGGSDLDDEGRAFMQRYGVRGYPTMLAMTADGAVIGRSFQRTVEGIMAGMAEAGKADEEFRGKEAELSKKTDVESVRTLASLYRDRAQFEKAREGYQKLASADAPEIEDQMALLDVLSGLGAKDDRKALLQKLIETRKDDERHIKWRMDLATADLPAQISSREEYMAVMAKRKDAYTKLLETVDKPADQAVVRSELANALAGTGDREGAMVHWTWILENARDSKQAAVALFMSAQMLWQMGQNDVTKLEEAKVLLQEIVEKHSGHRVAQGAQRGLALIEGKIAELKKKAEEEKSDDEEDEEGDEEAPAK